MARAAARLGVPLAANCIVGHAGRSARADAGALGRQPARGGAPRTPDARCSPSQPHAVAAAGRRQPRARSSRSRRRSPTPTSSFASRPRRAAGGRRLARRRQGRRHRRSRRRLGGGLRADRGARGAARRRGRLLARRDDVRLAPAHRPGRADGERRSRPRSTSPAASPARRSTSPAARARSGSSRSTPTARRRSCRVADYAVIGDLHEVAAGDLGRAAAGGTARRSLARARLMETTALRRSRSLAVARGRGRRSSPGARSCSTGSSGSGKPVAALRRRARGGVRNEAVVVLGQRKLFQRLVPGLDPRVHLLGLPRPLPDDRDGADRRRREGRDAAVARPSGLVRLPRRPLRACSCSSASSSAFWIRKVQRPERFEGSHLGEADLILGLIALIVTDAARSGTRR